MTGRWWNPVLRRELLERWRGRRAVAVLTFHIALLGGLLLLARWLGTSYLEQQAIHRFGPAGVASGPVLGRFLLENLLAGVLGLVLFVAPGYAAAQLAGEHERRTLGLLRITLLRPRSIVLGKLGASTAWILLLVLVTAPLAATALPLGGTTPADLARGLLVVVVVAVAVAAMALGVSSRARRTTGAVVMTYAVVLGLVVGTLLAGFAEFAARGFEMDGDRRPVALYLNPFYALADATGASVEGPVRGQLPSVLTPFAAALPRHHDALFGRGPGRGAGADIAVVEDPEVMVESVEDGMVVEERGTVPAPAEPVPPPEPVRPGPRPGPGPGPRPVPAPVDRAPAGGGGRPVWPITTLAYALLAAAALTGATRSLGPREHGAGA